VGAALHLNPSLGNQLIRIEADAGHVVLQGTVGSFYQKQMAQEAARNVEGVDQIENQLEVCWS
jgi:osmotically-inducible protein OsmY